MVGTVTRWFRQLVNQRKKENRGMEDYEMESYSGFGMLKELDPLIDQVARLTDGQRYWVTQTARQLAKEYELYGLPEDPFHEMRKSIVRGFRVDNDPYGTGVHHKLNMNTWKATTTKRTKVKAVLTSPLERWLGSIQR